MAKEEKIATILRKICKVDSDNSFIAKVIENYPNEEYVDVKALDDTQYNKVRKKSGIDGTKGILFTPLANSFVIVTRIEDSNDLFISKYGELHSLKIELFDKQVLLSEDQIYFKSNTQELNITNDGIIMNGGNNGGLIKIETIKTELGKNNQILQALLTVLSGTPITEPGNGSPSALQVALKAALTGKTIGSFSNMEDTKVTH